MSSDKPDIVVGIDVGQTCSGVAYSIGTDWSEPRPLNKWPGLDGFEKADKVATRVGYGKAKGNLKSWGFGATFADDSVVVREQFKLTLDAEYEDDRGFSCHDAREWYFDYIKSLHGEIEKFFDTAYTEVKSTERKIELEPLDHVEGVPIGSTLIDFRMAEHIVKRPRLVQEHLEGDPLCLAEEMLTGRFQTVKHSFPFPVVDEFKLDVKGLVGKHSFPEAGIVDSSMIIDRQTLLDIFDQQLEQIFHLIDHRLLALQAEFPSERCRISSFQAVSGARRTCWRRLRDGIR